MLFCGSSSRSSTDLRMSAIDEIIGYKKNPDEDLYGMLNCNEHSTVSVVGPKGLNVIWSSSSSFQVFALNNKT